MINQEQLNRIYNSDGLAGMSQLPDKSVDLILCDLPYGTTKNRWDSVIPFDKLWKEYKRVIKDNGAIVLTGQGLFTAKLITSNEKMFRYTLVWDKVLPSGFLNANRQPLRSHEDIIVFYKKLPTYNPQKTEGKPNNSKGKMVKNTNNNYGQFTPIDNGDKGSHLKYPKSIITESKPHPSTMIHPTQKPVNLFSYLIKTYTNEGDIVLDNCMGSGTTAIACLETGRYYIGYELDTSIYTTALNRINDWHKDNPKKQRGG